MEKYIEFTNNQQRLALDISQVERIIEFQKPKLIPEASDYLLGVIQYDQKILPIIDLTNRLYNIEFVPKEDKKVIVAIWKNKTVGLVVDTILGIYNFNEEEFEESLNEAQISKEYILGFIKDEEDITIVLDLEKIFDEEQEEELILSATS